MTARVYVATDLAGLRAAYAAGALPSVLERVAAEADDEESEYDALMTAAGLAPDPRRRVVVVAETDETGDRPLPLADWVAIHCDVEDRAEGSDPEDELAWFATQEIGDLLGG